MGEEDKKPEEPKPAPPPAAEEPPKTAEKPPEEEKKPDDPPPPSPPQEIILKVYMHCEGCARKVRRCLKGFDGVEDVTTDCKTSKVVVKGEKADPVKVLERVQRKSHRQVELISPIPPPPAPAEEKEPPKVEEKKEVQVQPPVITVVLGVYMHCEACAQELKKRIQRMKGVESVEPDLKSSQVAVKGALDAEKLVDHVLKRTGKHATIIKTEPEKKEEEKKEEKKAEEPEKEAKKEEEGGDKEKKEGSGDGTTKATEAGADAEKEKETKVEVEVKKNEVQQYYYYPHYHHQQLQLQQQQQVYPQRFVQEYQHEYPSPQMFSDENPNACTVM